MDGRDCMTLDPRVRLTFSTVEWDGEDEEPIEDHGWADTRGGRYEEPTEGDSMVPDQWDTEDGITAISKAVDFLNDLGAVYPSSSPHFHRGIWYSTEPVQDYRTGIDETLSAHLYGFNYAEEFFIWLHVTGKEGTAPCFT